MPAINFPRLHFHITTRAGSAVMMSPRNQEEGDVEEEGGGELERKGGGKREKEREQRGGLGMDGSLEQKRHTPL